MHEFWEIIMCKFQAIKFERDMRHGQYITFSEQTNLKELWAKERHLSLNKGFLGCL